MGPRKLTLSIAEYKNIVRKNGPYIFGFRQILRYNVCGLRLQCFMFVGDSFLDEALLF